MKLDSTSAIRPQTFEEWHNILSKLREAAMSAEHAAMASKLLWIDQAIKYSHSVLESKGIKPGVLVNVLPRYSSDWRYGAEFAYCAHNEYEGSITVMGYKLLKDGSRTKHGGPWYLGKVEDWEKNISLRK